MSLLALALPLLPFPDSIPPPSLFSLAHPQGGHGALTIYLREAGLYRSCSAFAPICHPSACPWGQKAFSGYFASASEGLAHDATELISKCKPEERKLDILIDSGLADNFYEQGQLLPEDFAKKAMENGYDDKQITLRLQEG